MFSERFQAFPSRFSPSHPLLHALDHLSFWRSPTVSGEGRGGFRKCGVWLQPQARFAYIAAACGIRGSLLEKRSNSPRRVQFSGVVEGRSARSRMPGGSSRRPATVTTPADARCSACFTSTRRASPAIPRRRASTTNVAASSIFRTPVEISALCMRTGSVSRSTSRGLESSSSAHVRRSSASAAAASGIFTSRPGRRARSEQGGQALRAGLPARRRLGMPEGPAHERTKVSSTSELPLPSRAAPCTS